MREYQKIPSPFKRHTDGPNRNKFTTEWSSPELEYTSHLQWNWTEKVDGTNIRIDWDGHRVTYGGRTENAQIPAKLIKVLDDLFPEELFEQQFGETEVTLYGEGYGAGIRSGGVYRPDQSFVMFDAMIGNFWLNRTSLIDIANGMGISLVPKVLVGPIELAIQKITDGFKSRWNSEHTMEGLVGVTEGGLLDRSGRRLIVKVKIKDFV